MRELSIKSPSSIPQYSWDAPGGASISMAVTVAEQIKQEVMDAFRALPRRGLEIGGVLLGRVVRRDPLEVVVDAFEPVPCEHRLGPALILSDVDRAQLEQILARLRAQPESSIVGYYRSFTGREIELDKTDQELIQKDFSDPEQVILAINPVSFNKCVGWWFARQDGHLPAKPAGAPFPFPNGQIANHSGQLEPSAEVASERDSEPAGAADSPEPEPVSPASLPPLRRFSPEGGSEPKPAVARFFLPWALGVVSGLAAFAFLYPWGETSGTQQALRVGLAAQRTASGIEVTWDHSPPTLQKATGGLLAINDGSSERRVELDRAAVARGRLIYEPSGSDLLFRLSIFGPGKQSATESFRMALAAPSPPPPVNRPETATGVPATPEVPPQPDRRPRARPEATPEAAVAAEVIHEVRPGISEAILARLRSPVTVPVNVKIDSAGKVTGATAQGGGDGVYRYLAERATHAARFWRFRPARGKNGKPVPSTQTLFFLFRG
jgi:hypothetical protein